jgi:hypothetical protein
MHSRAPISEWIVDTNHKRGGGPSQSWARVLAYIEAAAGSSRNRGETGLRAFEAVWYEF